MLRDEDGMAAHRRLPPVILRHRRREPLVDEGARMGDHGLDPPVGEVARVLVAEAEAAAECGSRKRIESIVERPHDAGPELQNLFEKCIMSGGREMLMRVVPTFAFLALAVAAAGAAEARGDRKYDPKQIICVKAKETGSRLGGKKICMTAAEWKDHRDQVRDEINERQIRQVNPQG